jgi:glycosyltransferase involved in cell wall biosynthesis
VLVYLRAAARQRQMRAHLRKVLTDLSEAGVRAAVLKGPYVALSYGNPRLRMYGDLDLLVPREDLALALEVLAADPAVPFIPPKRPRADKRDVPFHDPSGLHFTVDLHWDLFSYSQLRGRAEGATRWAWDRAVEDAGHELGPLWELPLEVRLAFLCTHAILDHRFRLILFRDLAEVAHHSVDWEELERYASRWGLRTTSYLALLMAARVAGAAVPEGLLTQLRPRNIPTRTVEWMLRRVDVVRFDGHRPHLLNLGVVLLHDDFADRVRLAGRALLALPEWRRRVGLDRQAGKHPLGARAGSNSIAIVVSSDRRRGAEVFGERLSDGLREMGWDTQMLALATDGGGARVRAKALSRRSPERLGRLDLDVMRALRRELRAQGPSIVLANGSSTLQYSLAALIGLRPRPLLVYRSIGEPLYWIRSPRHRLLQRALLRRVDLVVAVSTVTARQLVSELGLSAGRVTVVHIGVPETFLQVVPEPSDHVLRLLFLGNLSAEKNPTGAVEVLRRLNTSIPARLRFVGSGPLQAQVEQAAKDLGVGDIVEMVGSVSDVRPHLAWADVLVLPSLTEGLPGAVLEAAASMVPAVAFDVGGTRDVVWDGITGCLIGAGDMEGFVAALRSLGEDESFRSRLSKAARETVEERFTLGHSVGRYHQILASAVGRQEAP